MNDLDNVIFEIGNECHGGSTAWQYHMIDVIRRYEQTKPKQHPVWMTFQWDGMDGSGTNQDLFESTAEAISPGSASGAAKKAYELDPPAATGNKVVIVDTDHVNPGSLDRADWVWKCFTRGLHPIFMDNPPIRGNDKHPTLADWAPDGPSAKTRAAMGHTLTYARKMNLADMTPTDDAKVCSTRYCLRNPGVEYLVFQPQDEPIVLQLPAATWQVEWFDPRAGYGRANEASDHGRGQEQLSCTVRRLGSSVSQGSALTCSRQTEMPMSLGDRVLAVSKSLAAVVG